jgi:altronate hydrolase
MSLVALSGPPTAANAVLRLHPADNAGIARVALPAGFAFSLVDLGAVTRAPIAAGHKIALTEFAPGDVVRRYGHEIGRARSPIAPGDHLHTHNVDFYEPARDFAFPAGELPPPDPPADAPVFRGYLRADGRAGTRNYIAVVAASNCAAHVVERIARSYENETLPPGVDGVVAFPHADGCGYPDTRKLRHTIAGVVAHPNVAGALLVGLGCEANQISYYFSERGPQGVRLQGLTLQESGGTAKTIAAARDAIAPLLAAAAAETRTEIPVAKLVVGLNCGGSDSFSGITANPALGVCSDLLVGFGATAVLAETPECFGAEHLLVKRARSRAVAERFLGFLEDYRRYLARFGDEYNFNQNPSPGNKAGGLTTVLEKSLGAVAKAGATPLTEAVDYAGRIRGPGVVFMNTPGYDPVSLTGLAAGGANLIAFTTGRGSAIGFPTVPVVKIATNSAMFHRLRDNMEINAGRIADGEATVEEVGREIFALLLRVAGGERTAAERFGHREFVPWQTGPTL